MSVKNKNDKTIPFGKTAEYRKEYYLKNRDKILAQWKEKTECTFCHKVVTKNNYPRHCLSSKHQLAELLLKKMNKKKPNK